MKPEESETKSNNYEEAIKIGIEDYKKESFGIWAEGYRNGVTSSNKRKVFPRKNFQVEEIRSTILLPEKYLEHFQKRIVQYEGVRSYIAHLLSKYKIHISNGIVPAYSNLATKYQEKNQNLQKISFRPLAEDWAELKLYRVAFGMSISAFLVYLVIADSVDLAETVSHLLVAVGVPTLSKQDLTAKIYLWEKRSYYSIVFQVRRDYYG